MIERTFTEEEVAALFRRASELQAEQNSKGVQRGSAEKAGLTIDEVSAIAAEAGLDPDHVRRAAAEMNRSAIVDQRGKSSVRDTEIFAERRVPVSIGERLSRTSSPSCVIAMTPPQAPIWGCRITERVRPRALGEASSGSIRTCRASRRACCCSRVTTTFAFASASEVSGAG